MSSKIILKVKEGSLKGQEFTYDECVRLVVGRSDNCPIRFEEMTVSRCHCVLEINPPEVLVRDFGSFNGTYLNGELIGQRERSLSPQDGQQRIYTDFKMKAGDSLGLGKFCEIVMEIEETCDLNATFADATFDKKKVTQAAEHPVVEQLAAESPAATSVCADCQCEIAEPVHINETGQPLCEKCHEEKERKIRKQKIQELIKAEAIKAKQNPKVEAEKVTKEPAKKEDNCIVCGKLLGKEANRTNICPKCRKSPIDLLQLLFLKAKKASDDSIEIAGYRNIKMLGRGGMGQVWLVEEEKTGERMALKLMLPQMASSESAIKNFLREAYIGMSLEHENVVRHYKCGHSGDLFFILMEFCKGKSLDKLLESKGGYLGRNEKDIAIATSITLQVLDGLYYSHNATVPVILKNGEVEDRDGIVHRDFKPGNIFIANEDTTRPIAKVADFGLAKAFDAAGLTNNTGENITCGTIHFMPRLQVYNSKYSKPDVDVWATAASYYLMLTGHLPRDFRGRSISEQLDEVLTKNAVPIQKRNSTIPEALANVIDTVLMEMDDSEIGIHKIIRDTYGVVSTDKYKKEVALLFKQKIWEVLPLNYKKNVLEILPPYTKNNIAR